jgi:uncharacterized membrane protein
MTRFLRLSLICVLLAVGLHFLTIAAMPRVLMAIASARMQEQGMVFNEMVHPGPRTAEEQTIVRPSPDLLYSVCLYEVTAGPIRISTSTMPDTYWSISGFAANTDNFFVINDVMAGSEPVDVTIGRIGADPGDVDYHSPSARGMILLRMLMKDGDALPALEEARRMVGCEAVN